MIAVQIVVVLLLASSAIATFQLGQGRGGRFITGGSDGVGGIPFAGGPSTTDPTVPYFLTLGLVVDSEEIALPFVPVVVLSVDGAVVAGGVTDERGMFAVQLPDVSGLTVSLPMNGVYELPITAGVPVLIVVP